MDLVVYDDDEKRYVPWAVALTAVLLVALLTAALTFLLARQASGSDDEPAVRGVSTPEPATAPSATPSAAAPAAAAPVGPAPAPDCGTALLRADAALDRSQVVEQALAEHTAIMDELLAERITAQQALDRTLPVLTDGATARRAMQEAVAAYSAARQACPS